MTRDVIRAREVLANAACNDAERLRRIAKGEEVGDADRLANQLEQAIHMLVRVPADVIE